MEKNNQNNKQDDFQNNSFIEAQKEAEDGKAGKKSSKMVEEKSEAKAKAKDELMRAKNADKEVTTESEKYRRDNA
ncbi:hypothetical protein [Cyclobacterium qasimii]|uniref:Uncharacterized protein n=2 Tax=Cyclobacterium qasimii TaxID=1350429 RepID=S7VN69_9BACT|nr:hypothetical protein [Cyclobacterium qasimii]EPR70822.1 hypothetical protein ADICYQ_0818 [Cyclobacterium qasimii M12-11B]GEO24071.1 hypothetical protein CQA01_46050 [Cyclobacterium qasimii]